MLLKLPHGWPRKSPSTHNFDQWPGVWGQSSGLLSSLLRARGEHILATMEQGGRGALQLSPRPQGTYLGLLRGRGLLPLLVRADEAAKSRRNWKRYLAQRPPPTPCASSQPLSAASVRKPASSTLQLAPRVLSPTLSQCLALQSTLKTPKNTQLSVITHAQDQKSSYPQGWDSGDFHCLKHFFTVFTFVTVSM